MFNYYTQTQTFYRCSRKIQTCKVTHYIKKNIKPMFKPKNFILVLNIKNNSNLARHFIRSISVLQHPSLYIITQKMSRRHKGSLRSTMHPTRHCILLSCNMYIYIYIYLCYIYVCFLLYICPTAAIGNSMATLYSIFRCGCYTIEDVLQSSNNYSNKTLHFIIMQHV